MRFNANGQAPSPKHLFVGEPEHQSTRVLAAGLRLDETPRPPPKCSLGMMMLGLLLQAEFASYSEAGLIIIAMAC
jgi:hypothetical protein